MISLSQIQHQEDVGNMLTYGMIPGGKMLKDVDIDDDAFSVSRPSFTHDRSRKNTAPQSTVLKKRIGLAEVELTS
jgi:hypothetical protein